MKRLVFMLLGVVLVLHCVLGGTKSVNAEEAREFSARIAWDYVFAEEEKQIYIYSSTLDCECSAYSFQSSNTKIATVNENGILEGKSFGDATITVTYKEEPSIKDTFDVHVYDKEYLVIYGPSSLKAGNTYQFTASKENVVWSVWNLEGDKGTASVDSKTGEVKVRTKGSFYIEGKTTDGRYYGCTQVSVNGPEVTSDVIDFGEFTLDEDLHIIDAKQLNAYFDLPKTVTLDYSYGKKTGTVKADVVWDFAQWWSMDEITETGTYELKGKVYCDEKYAVNGAAYCSARLVVNVPQTDDRVKIVKIKDSKLVIKKDLFLSENWHLFDVYSDEQLTCIDEDGKKIKTGVYSTHRITPDTEYIVNKGTYVFEVEPQLPLDYCLAEGVVGKLEVVIKVKQSFFDSYQQTNDEAAGFTWVFMPTTQDGLKVK